MTSDVQPDEPPAELLAVARDVVPGWLRRITIAAASIDGEPSAELTAEIDAMVDGHAHRLLADLATLLAADVDEQPTNPLSVLRSGVAAPTALLRAHDVPVPPPDPFGAERFPDDVYRLGPATWADIDPAMHEPGLTWGAWKAMTVLRRRRDEGLR